MATTLIKRAFRKYPSTVFYSVNSGVNSVQIEHFNKFKEEWWNPNGPMRLLHRMNDLRIPLVRDGLVKNGIVKKEALGTSRPLDGVSILDAGCGAGILSESLTRNGARVVGIDPSQQLINHAKAHIESDKELKDLSYVCTVVQEHALTCAEQYDAVVASEVVEHINEWEPFLKECVKCTKPGGSLFVSTINKTFYSLITIVGIAELFKLIPRGTHEWRMLVPPQDVQRVLEASGCRIESIRGMFYNPFIRKWSWIKGTSLFYAIHAIKEQKK